MNVNESIIRINSYNNFSAANKTTSFTQATVDKNVNSKIIATTIIGTLLPVLILRKYQNKKLNPAILKKMDFKHKAKEIFKSFHIEYGFKEMTFTSFGAILGGLSGGLMFDKKENKKCKIKESIFQFSNVVIPTGILAGLLTLIKKSEHAKSVFPKIAAIAMSVGIGMPIAAAFSSEVNNVLVDPKCPSRRKLRLKDCFVHIDDLVGALILAKVPFANKIQADKILPVLYGMCGYEAGTK